LSAVCYFSYQFLANYFVGTSFLIRLVEVFVPMALGGIAFIVIAKLLRIDELEKIYRAAAAKLSK